MLGSGVDAGESGVGGSGAGAGRASNAQSVTFPTSPMLNTTPTNVFSSLSNSYIVK